MLKFSILAIIVSLSLLTILVHSALDPTHFSQQIMSLLPKQVRLLHYDMGRTVNGYNIMAYGLTSLEGLPQKWEITGISYYPATLILSYMRNTDENSVNLLYGYIANALRRYQNDYYMQTVLKTGFIWFVPFFNIDAYQSYKLNDTSKSFKNMNKYPDKTNQINCQQQNSVNKYGVNLDYNFLQQRGNKFTDICNDFYAGPSPFSQKQSQNLKKFIQSLNFNLVIDIQGGDNLWVHPAKNIIKQNFKYNFLYQDITRKLQKSHKIVQQNSGQNQSYSGGFINWAASKNILSFKYLITQQTNGEQLQNAVVSAYSGIQMLIKKNAPIYNKYKSSDSKKLYIQPISLYQFQIRLQIVVAFKETVSKNYLVQLGKVTELSLQLQQTQKSSKKYHGEPAYHLFVLNTLIAQVLDLRTIPIIPESLLQKYQERVQIQSNKQISLIQVSIIFVVLIFAGAFVLFFVFRNNFTHKNHQKKNKNIYKVLEQEDTTKL